MAFNLLELVGRMYFSLSDFLDTDLRGLEPAGANRAVPRDES